MKRFLIGVLALCFVHVSHAQQDSFNESFEFSSNGSFTRGEAPFTVTFNGGRTFTVGQPGLYRSGAFSWGASPFGPSQANFVFNTPAKEISLWWRAWDASDDGTLEFVDTEGAVVATFDNPIMAFQQVEVSREPGQTSLAELRITQTAGSRELLIDDFFYEAEDPPPPEPEFEINAGVTGNWFDPDTSGQGFMIEPIIRDNGQNELFVAWFTYDTNPPAMDELDGFGSRQHRWFVGQGPFDGDTATMDMILPTGGIFDNDQSTENLVVGTFVIVFSSCTEAVGQYSFDDGPSGTIDLQRLTPDNFCQVLVDIGDGDGDDG